MWTTWLILIHIGAVGISFHNFDGAKLLARLEKDGMMENCAMHKVDGEDLQGRQPGQKTSERGTLAVQVGLPAAILVLPKIRKQPRSDGGVGDASRIKGFHRTLRGSCGQGLVGVEVRGDHAVEGRG